MNNPRRRRIQTKKTSINRGFLSLIIVFLILGIFSYYSINSNSNQPVQVSINQIANTSTGTVELTASPAVIMATQNHDYSFTLNLDSGTSKLTAIQIELSYNPDIINITEIVQGNFFQNVLLSPKIANGKASFAYAASPDSGGVSGTGSLATIKLNALNPGSANLQFSGETTAMAVDEIDNMLKSAQLSEITVVSATSDLPPIKDITPTSIPVKTTEPTQTQLPPNTPPTTQSQLVGSPPISQPDSTPNSYVSTETEELADPGEYAFTQEELDSKYAPKTNLLVRIIEYLKQLLPQSEPALD